MNWRLDVSAELTALRAARSESPAETIEAPEPWVVWSNEHEAWWRAESRGYCTDLRGAGIYTEEEAKRCEGMRSPMRDGRVPEVAMPLSRALLTSADTGELFIIPPKNTVRALLAELLPLRVARSEFSK